MLNGISLFISDLQKELSPAQILLHEPMRNHTTFKIGGPADCLILPRSADEVVVLFKLIKKYGLPFTVIGNGSNLLVLDKGIRGVVVKLENGMSYMRVEGNTLIAGAGTLLKDVAEYAAESSLTGLEFAIGIPGSIGGAVFMNAGAYDGDISHVVSAVTAVSLEGEVIRYTPDSLEFSYRHSVFQKNQHVICEVELALAQGERKDIVIKMADLTMRRESKQPLEVPSAGSTFKRPEGYFAGTLIEQTGLKGFTLGGAQISDKHAGFVVNSGQATAQDVLDLIQEVQRLVYEKHGVQLHPEVRLVGEP